MDLCLIQFIRRIHPPSRYQFHGHLNMEAFDPFLPTPSFVLVSILSAVLTTMSGVCGSQLGSTMLVYTALESDLQPFQTLQRFELRPSAVCLVLYLVIIYFITDSFLGVPSQFAFQPPPTFFEGVLVGV